MLKALWRLTQAIDYNNYQLPSVSDNGVEVQISVVSVCPKLENRLNDNEEF